MWSVKVNVFRGFADIVMMFIRSIFFSLLFIVFPVSAGATEEAVEQSAVAEQQETLFSNQLAPVSKTTTSGSTAAGVPATSIGEIAFVLAGMILLILVLAFWVKKLQGFQQSFGSQHIKTLSVTSIGVKEKIALISVGEQQLLIGVTPASIQTLMVLEEPVETTDTQDQSGFREILKKALNKS